MLATYSWSAMRAQIMSSAWCFRVYRERLSRLQMVAACSASLGVVHVYGPLEACPGWLWRCAWASRPILSCARPCGLNIWVVCGSRCCWRCCWPPGWSCVPHRVPTFAAHVVLYPLIVGLALISTVALMSYILASRRLPLSLFGLLGYVEPVLITAAALMLGERIDPDAWPSYLPIWAAVLLLMLDGVWRLRARHLSEAGNA